MERILIYKIERESPLGETEREESHSLLPWDEDAAGERGEDDGGRHYLLPAGYTLLEREGVPAVYSDDGICCTIRTHNAAPLLIDEGKKLAILLEREKKIWDRREAAGLTREELAGRIGVPQPLLYEWENCEKEPDMRSLRALAGVLGCEVFDLT